MYQIRISSPTRFPAIPEPSRWSRYWSSIESVPYQLQTWWRNAKRRLRWRKYVLVECDGCSELHLSYRVEPVFARNGLVTMECRECREASAFARLIIRHLENK